LVLLGRHQATIRAQEVVLLADDDVDIVFGAASRYQIGPLAATRR
jgi:hypothetical protein